MSPHKKTVLVVDDTAENIDLLVAALRDEYLVKAAINGEMALKIVEKSPPDIILLDIMMPGIDGFEVCRRLRSNPRLAEIPIILVTALDDRQSRLQ